MVLKKETLTSPDSPILVVHELPLPRETRKKINELSERNEE
jgi:hypothetical protein